MKIARYSAGLSVFLACFAYFCFNVGDAVVKLAAQKFHFSEIVFFNCVFAIIFAVIFGALTGGKAAFRVTNKKLVALRGALAVIVAFLNVPALAHISLSEFYTLIFTAPFWVALLSAFVLKEKLEPAKLAIILGGFAVVLLTFSPGSGLLTVWAGLTLLSALVYASSMIVMRYMGPHESRTMLVIVSSVMGLLAAFPFMLGNFTALTVGDLGYFAVTGFCYGAGSYCVAYAFQHAPSAATVAPCHYTQIVWGVALGYFMFGEMPDVRVLIGAALIITGGLYLIYSAARAKRREVLATRV